MTGTGSFTCDLCAVTKPTFQRYPDKGTDYAPDGTPLFTWANVTTEGWCWECNTGTPRPYRYQDLTHREPGHGLGAPVPTCPGCGVAVVLFDDDTHTCKPEPDPVTA